MIGIKNYLTYSLYRVDVILRETIVIGVVGGVGLGWQLKESLSSFAWEEVLVVTLAFTSLTLIGERINEFIHQRIHDSSKYNISDYAY